MNLEDGNVHVLPLFSYTYSGAGRRDFTPIDWTGFVITWRDDLGKMQKRRMISYFLITRWAKEIAKDRGVEVVEHLIIQE